MAIALLISSGLATINPPEEKPSGTVTRHEAGTDMPTQSKAGVMVEGALEFFSTHASAPAAPGVVTYTSGTATDRA